MSPSGGPVPGCRACALPPLDGAAIAALEAELGLPADQLSPPTERDRRLAICSGCEYLSGSHTCLMCGCLVQLRALQLSAICPHPARAGW